MATLLDFFGQRIKDAEKGIGSFINGAASTANDAVNNVSRAVAPQPQRPQVRPPQVGVNAPQGPQFKSSVPTVPKFNAATVSQNSVINQTKPQTGGGLDPVGFVRDAVVKPVLDSATTVGNAYASGANYLANEVNGQHAAQQKEIIDQQRQAYSNAARSLTAPSQYVAAPGKPNAQSLMRQAQGNLNVANTAYQNQQRQAQDVQQNNDPLKVGAASINLASTIAAPAMSKLATPIVDALNPLVRTPVAKFVGNAISQIPTGLVVGGTAPIQQSGMNTNINDVINSAVQGAGGAALLGGTIPVAADVAKLGLKGGKAFYNTPEDGFAKIPSNKAVRQTGNIQNVNPDLTMKQPMSQAGEIPTGQVSPILQEAGTAKIPSGSGVSLDQNANRSSLPLSEQQTAIGQPQIPVSKEQIGGMPSFNGPRERGFIETVINDPNTASHIKDSLTSLYTVRNTKELQTRAANLVKDNPDLARRVAEGGQGDISVATGSELLKHMQSKGEFENAINLADNLAKQLTEAGRTAQAASIYGRLTPEGILRFAQKEINKYNEVNKLLGNKKLSLTAEQAAKLTAKSDAINKMPLGRERDIASKELVTDIYKLIPASKVRMASTLQTMAQLLNPKTSTRNILGNAMFGATDNVAQVGAAGIDKVLSKVRGTERTVALPNLKTQFEGIKTGGKQAYEEVLKGVNLGPNTQFELGDVPTFRSGVMGGLEKTMGVTLRVPDRAAYQATFDDTVKGLMKANKLDKPTQEILEMANANGLYRTFQDNSKAAQLFTGIKGALNNVGFTGKDGQKFGLGDLILKYPKTPGNILARGIDYSPVGIVKGILEIAKPAIKKQPFDQAAFSNAISRGTLGTAAIGGAGAVLGSLGIITEAPNTDADARNLQKSSGQGGYQINIDALRRFVLSGFNKDEAKIKEGDTLVSYDWAQPLSIPLSAGAAIGKGQNAVDGATSTVENISQGLNTLIEQPLVTGINTFANNIKNKGFVGAGLETLKGAPASFVPTASNQARQLTDNTTRSTYDPNSAVEAVNKLTNRIPGLSYLLNPQVDSLGSDKKNFQNDSNNIFNVMFNPAFVNKYQPQDAAKLPLGILSDTGETKQIPTTTKTSQKVNGTNIDLTAKQNVDFQRFVGTKTKDYLTQASKDPKFMKLSPQDQAARISDAISSIQSAAKISLLGDKPKKVDNSVKNIINTGNAKLVTKPVDSNGGGSVDINSKLSGDYSKVLDNYNNMTSDEQKKLFNDTPDAEYKYNLAKFENDKANGTLSEAQKLTTAKSLRTAKIGANYSKNVRDLYGVSKADLADYLATEEKGVDKKKIAEDLYAYDKALYDSGASSSLKYKYGIGGSGKGKGGRKGKGTASAKNLVNLTKYANGIRPPKTTGSTGKAPSMKTPQLKKSAVRKFAVKSASVKGTKSRRSNSVQA